MSPKEQRGVLSPTRVSPCTVGAWWSSQADLTCLKNMSAHRISNVVNGCNKHILGSCGHRHGQQSGVLSQKATLERPVVFTGNCPNKDVISLEEPCTYFQQISDEKRQKKRKCGVSMCACVLRVCARVPACLCGFQQKLCKSDLLSLGFPFYFF